MNPHIYEAATVEGEPSEPYLAAPAVERAEERRR